MKPNAADGTFGAASQGLQKTLEEGGGIMRFPRRILNLFTLLAFCGAPLGVMAEEARFVRNYEGMENGIVMNIYSVWSNLNYVIPTLGDLDGDNDLDLVVGSGSIRFYRNEGAPSNPIWMLKSDSYFVPENDVYYGTALGDVDNDGDLDLFIGSKHNGVIYYRNDGSPGVPVWASPVLDCVPSIGASRPSPALADINGDGLLDLFVGEGGTSVGYGAIDYYENLEIDPGTQNPVWDAVVDYYAGVYSVWSPQFTDIDGDGDLDLFVVGKNGPDYRIHLYENQGTKTSPSWTGTPSDNDFLGSTIDYSGTRGLHSFTFGDIGSDGDQDLIVSIGWREWYEDVTLQFYRNDGTSQSANFVFGSNAYDTRSIAGYGRNIALLDEDGNGTLDFLACGSALQGCTWIRNDGSPLVPHWTDPESATFSGLPTDEYVPAVVDLDADDDPDLFFGRRSDGTLYYCRYDGGWQTAILVSGVSMGSESAPALADMDQDGDLDLIMGGVPGGQYKVYYYENNSVSHNPSEVTFAAPLEVSTNELSGTYSYVPEIVDMNGDGHLDILVGKRDTNDGDANGTTVSYYENPGSGSPAPSWYVRRSYQEDMKLPYGITSGGLVPRSADIDADGDDDLLLGGGASGMSFWRNVTPGITVTPRNVALGSGEAYTFTATGNTGPIQWSVFYAAPGGGYFLDPDVGEYTAGANEDVFEIVQALDTVTGQKGRAVVSILSEAEVEAIGVAIIVAGGYGPGDDLWSSTNHLANQAYLTLRARGFKKENIKYFSHERDQDVDGNGSQDDILETPPSWEALEMEIAGVTSDKLTIYAVDHGSPIGFVINDSDVLSGEALNAMLDGRDALIIYDACNSGTFHLGALVRPGNMIVSSSNEESISYFALDGKFSFSNYFWLHVMSGASVGAAFDGGVRNISTVSAQDPQIDTDGTAPINTVADMELAYDTYIGSTLTIGAVEIPQILDVSPEQVIAGNDAEIEATGVNARYLVSSVDAIILDPSYVPPSPGDIEDGTRPGFHPISLDPDPLVDHRYSKVYSGFVEDGAYRVIISALDAQFNVSSRKLTYVIKGSACGDDVGGDWFDENSLDDEMYTTTNELIPAAPAQEHWFYRDGPADQDWAYFDAEEGKTYSVKTERVSPQANTVINVYADGDDPAVDEPVESLDQYGYGFTERLLFYCTDAGRYYVQVVQANPGVQGLNTCYQLSLDVEGGDTGIQKVLVLTMEDDPVTDAEVEGTCIDPGCETEYTFVNLGGGYYRHEAIRAPKNYSITAKTEDASGGTTKYITPLINQDVTVRVKTDGTCLDQDEDGYGNPGSSRCDSDEKDCNDANPDVNPGMTEILKNGIDDDCDPSTLDDPGGVCAAAPMAQVPIEDLDPVSLTGTGKGLAVLLFPLILSGVILCRRRGRKRR
jgi:hypothetical protein